MCSAAGVSAATMQSRVGKKKLIQVRARRRGASPRSPSLSAMTQLAGQGRPGHRLQLAVRTTEQHASRTRGCSTRDDMEHGSLLLVPTPSNRPSLALLLHPSATRTASHCCCGCACDCPYFRFGICTCSATEHRAESCTQTVVAPNPPKRYPLGVHTIPRTSVLGNATL